MHLLFKLALGRNWKCTAFIVVVNILSGVMLMSFLSQVRVLSEDFSSVATGTLVYVIILTLGIGLISALSEYLIGQIVALTESRFLTGMTRMVMGRPFQEVQKHGRETVDVIFRESGVISRQLELFLKSGKDVIILFFLLAYSASVSPIVTALTLVGGLLYELFTKQLRRRIRSAWGSGRGYQVRLLSRLRLIYDGFKELSLSAHAGKRFYEKEIVYNSRGMQMAQTKVALYEAIFVNAAQSVILGIAILGAFLIVRSQLISLPEVASLLVVFLLARGKIVSALRVYVRRDELLVAVKHVEALGIDLLQVDDQVVEAYAPLVEHFEKLSFDRLTFQHFEENEPSPFKVGPLSATFELGSIVFICGKNGSGKSTVAKLICGLYEPSGGSIECNGTTVETVDRRAYQQIFGAVFSDFCLFSPLFYSDDASIEAAFSELQKTFGLDKNLLDSDDLQSAGLSTGQRKRVALALAILEDKPIFIFDEWASDQDSNFRKFFYEIILKELVEKKKLIFVISHHEDYLHVADRVLEIERGQVRELVQ